jgi:hypothetical protein
VTEVDPIVTLMEALCAGHAPPLAWTIEWALDGTIDRAWAQSWNPAEMCMLLGVPFSHSHRQVPEWVERFARVLAKAVPAKHTKTIYFVRDASTNSIGLATVMIFEDMLPEPLAHRLRLTERVVAFIARATIEDMIKRANRLRKRYPVPPTLLELLERFEAT